MSDAEILGYQELLNAIDALKSRLGEGGFLQWSRTLHVRVLVSNYAYRRAICDKLIEMDRLE
jgi:hypothetical protein